MIFSMLIINKAGSLVHQLDFVTGDGLNGQGHPRLTENEYLVLAGTFHGVHAIASQISPIQTSSGIQILETDTFKLNCYQTLTGVKFIMTSSPSHSNIEQTLRQMYIIYSDLVMKNPFHTPEMPIRNKHFDEACRRAVGINAV